MPKRRQKMDIIEFSQSREFALISVIILRHTKKNLLTNFSCRFLEKSLRKLQRKPNVHELFSFIFFNGILCTLFFIFYDKKKQKICFFFCQKIYMHDVESGTFSFATAAFFGLFHSVCSVLKTWNQMLQYYFSSLI